MGKADVPIHAAAQTPVETTHVHYTVVQPTRTEANAGIDTKERTIEGRIDAESEDEVEVEDKADSKEGARSLGDDTESASDPVSTESEELVEARESSTHMGARSDSGLGDSRATVHCALGSIDEDETRLEQCGSKGVEANLLDVEAEEPQDGVQQRSGRKKSDQSEGTRKGGAEGRTCSQHHQHRRRRPDEGEERVSFEEGRKAAKRVNTGSWYVAIARSEEVIRVYAVRPGEDLNEVYGLDREMPDRSYLEEEKLHF